MMADSMKRDFEILEHTADAGIIAYGKDMPEAFANAARGLFSLIVDPDSINETLHRDVALEAADPPNLLVDWLNELIYLFDTEGTIFKRFDIIRLDPTHIEARAHGEKATSSKHEIKTGVKAATYHMLSITQDSGCQVRVLFDL